MAFQFPNAFIVAMYMTLVSERLSNKAVFESMQRLKNIQNLNSVKINPMYLPNKCFEKVGFSLISLFIKY